MPRIPDYLVSLLVQIHQIQLFSRPLECAHNQDLDDQVSADSG